MERRKYRTALITGAAHRIGAAIATDLCQHGYKVVIHHHDSEENAEKLAAALREDGGSADVIAGDLVSGDMAAIFADARDAVGPVGVLVNNASIFEQDTASAPDAELMRLHYVIHVQAPALLAAQFAAQPEVADGLVVNMIDQRVWRLNPRFFSYTLSKSALWTATRTMAMQFAPNVRVNAIGPGPTLPNERQSDADFRHQVEALPLESGPQLAEFGRTVRYLDDTPSITGQMIALDGGQHLAWKTPDTEGMEE